MNVSALFIQRPVATSLLMLSLLLFGVAGYALMPLAALPQVELPTIGILLLMGAVMIPASLWVFSWAENRAKRLGLLKRSG